MSVGREFLLVRTPPEFRREESLVDESLDAPRVDELPDRLGTVRHLRIAFGNVQSLDP